MRKRYSIAIAAFLIGTIALACNVPVFRYALERWVPDPYDVLVFHQGPLAATDKELVKQLTDAEDKGRANVRVHVVDLDGPQGAAGAVAAAVHRTQCPYMVVRYPEHFGNETVLWSGRLEAANVKMLLHSPVRKEISKRLTSGDSAVWVLLESGDAKQDDAVAQMAQSKLKQLPSVLKLPELTDDPEDKLQAGTPLKISFSLLRLSRRDPSERFLVRMLLESEDDLETRRVDPVNSASLVGLLGTGAPLAGLVGWQGQRARVEPLLFAVFGRGRSMFAWVGKGITPDSIESDCRFLTGPCSCTVKRMNPGFDLLLTADWDELITNKVAAKKDPPPELVGLSSLGKAAPKTEKPAEVKTTPQTKTPVAANVSVTAAPARETEATQPALWRNLLWVGLAGLIVLVAATFILLTKQKTHPS